MKSSSGKFYITLNHIKALACFMVFTWHFIHGCNYVGSPVRCDYVPVFFPFALSDEGHTAVSLFMTLSGYILAKLLDGQKIDYKVFLGNRIKRLLPLLVVVIGLVGMYNLVVGRNIVTYAVQIMKGVVFPSLPAGAWFLTIEFHCYLILPVVLWMIRKSKLLPFALIIASVSLRYLIFRVHGEVQSVAYWTLIGRIDQFVCGMLIYKYRSMVAHRHILSIGILGLFALYYWYFDLQGGFYNNYSYPSQSLLWVIHPAIEGVAYAIGIAWYDNSFSPSDTGFSRFVCRIGTYSYSIYLLHYFVVSSAVHFVHTRIMDISNFYLACFWSVICFVLFIPVGYLGYRFIESPFLNKRKTYIIK